MSKLRTNKSGLESFVEGYLSKYKKTNNHRKATPFVSKAIILINNFLVPACCDDPEAVVAHGRRDDALTEYIHVTLTNANKFNRRKFHKSLDRVLELLNDFITDPCC